MFPGEPHHPEHFDGEIKLIRELVSHPGYTLPVRVSGDSLSHVGIYANDVLVADRALTPTRGDTVIMTTGNGLTIEQLPSGLWLASDNHHRFLGVVTHVIHRL